MPWSASSMIDLSQFPSPADVPEPGACIRAERPEEGLAVVVFDAPHRSFGPRRPVARPRRGAHRARGGRSGISVGLHRQASGSVLAEGRGDRLTTDPGVVRQAVIAVHGLFEERRLAPRTIAAVGGPVPGCSSVDVVRRHRHRHSRTRIGPEDYWGSSPAGAAATVFLARRAPKALDAILTGRLFPAKKAWKMGMVDRLTKAEHLRAGRRRPRDGPRAHQAQATGLRRGSWTATDRSRGHPRSGAQGRRCEGPRELPCALRALDLVMAAPGRSLSEAARAEADAVAALAIGPVCICRHLLRLRGGQAGEVRGRPEPRADLRAAVVGGGIMGGIATSWRMCGGRGTSRGSQPRRPRRRHLAGTAGTPARGGASPRGRPTPPWTGSRSPSVSAESGRPTRPRRWPR